MIEKVAFLVFVSFLSVFALIFLWSMLVLMPVSLATEADCLEAGYPKHAVTWNLKTYCMNLEGTVTVKVEEIE